MSKLITYDLCTPGKDYSNLIAAIKTYPNWCKVAESCWVVNSADDCATIRDELKLHIDSNDILFVASLTGGAAWTNVLCKAESLKTTLSK